MFTPNSLICYKFLIVEPSFCNILENHELFIAYTVQHMYICKVKLFFSLLGIYLIKSLNCLTLLKYDIILKFQAKAFCVDCNV